MRAALSIYAFACMGIAFAPNCPAQPASSSEYSVREEPPPPRSIFPLKTRREVVRGSVVPVNKRYHEFTPEEKAVVQQWYEGTFGAQDEPPFPSDGLKPIYALMGKAQARLQVEGQVTVVATVGADGEVTSVAITGSPSAELSRFAAAALYNTKFKPGLCGGVPCTMDFPFRYRFGVK